MLLVITDKHRGPRLLRFGSLGNQFRGSVMDGHYVPVRSKLSLGFPFNVPLILTYFLGFVISLTCGPSNVIL